VQTLEHAAEQSQIGKKRKKERERENINLTRFGNFLRPRSRRERDLINQSIQVINTGDNTLLYIVRESTKKRKPTDLNSDLKRTQNLNRKLLKIVLRSNRRSTALCAGQVYALAGRPSG